MAIKRLDTVSVEIRAKAEDVWAFVADVRNWKQFSDFSKNMEQVGDQEWVAHTDDQGEIRVRTFFDAEHLTLDQICYPNGDEQLIPYRIIPKGDSCELMMTNQQTDGVSDTEYVQQLGWIRKELETVKKLLERRGKR